MSRIEFIDEKVREAVRKVSSFELDNVEDDDKLHDDLALESLELVELAMELEKKFGIELSDDECETFDEITVKQLITLVKSKL
ncbi:MAG: phosphopantetheine-binding protein [Azospirillum sp.]|nr:phosphopantetheine-binding protein [Azospirillum sp.]